jgi:homoserine dehydrogenase
MTVPDLSLVLVGFGHVGRRFVQLLTEVDDRLDFEWRVVGIATRRHGVAVDPDGIDLDRALAAVQANEPLDRRRALPRPASSGLDVIREAARLLIDQAEAGRLVVIESTVLDIDRGEPALSHVRAALEARMHVVTVNKGPAAFAYHELEALAGSVDRAFFFEGAVMDGVPIFNLARETMPAVRVEAFRGVINTTSNFVLSALEQGQSFDDALGEMQARGIAEADPSLDIDGWDAAAKTAALVNVLMGATITPHQVARIGIAGLQAADVRGALDRGRRIRLVASARRHGHALVARVEPEVLAAEDPLAGLADTANALYLTTDLLGEIGIVQREGNLTQTAYALLSDLTRISQRLNPSVHVS